MLQWGVNPEMYVARLSSNAPKKVAWRVEADPATHAWEFPSEVRLGMTIPFAAASGRGFQTPIKILYPDRPSVFVGLGLNDQANQQRHVWDLAARKRIGSIKKIALGGSELQALSPDGKYFAAQVSGSDIVGIYDVAAERPVAQINSGSSRDAGLISFGAGNRLLVLHDSSLKVYSVPGGTLEREIEAAEGLRWAGWVPGRPWSLSPGGRYLAIPDQRGFQTGALIIDIVSGEPAGRLIAPEEIRGSAQVSVGFSPDGQRLAFLVDEHSTTHLMIWDLAGGRMVSWSQRESGNLSQSVEGDREYTGACVDWFPGGDQILLYGRVVFDVESQSITRTLPGKGSFRIGLMGRDKIAVPKEDELVLYDLATVTGATEEWQKRTVPTESLIVNEGAPDPAERVADRSSMQQPGLEPAVAFSADPGGSAMPATTQPVSLGGGVLTYAAAAANGSRVVAGFVSEKPYITYGVTHNADRLASWVEHWQPGASSATRVDLPEALTLEAVSCSGDRVALRSLDGFQRVVVWNLATGRKEVGFVPYTEGSSKGSPVFWVGLPGDTRLLSLTEGRLTAWEIPSAKAEWEIAAGSVCVPALSASGRYVAVSDGEAVRVIETESGQVAVETRLTEEDTVVTGLAFDETGEQLAVVGTATGYGRISVIRCGTGEIASSFLIPVEAKQVQWLTPELLLLDGSYAVGVPQQAVVWVYTLKRGSHVVSHAGPAHAVIETDASQRNPMGGVIRLPDVALTAALASGKQPAREFVLQPGESVALDVQVTAPNVSHLDQQVRESLTQRLGDRGITVAAGAPLTLKVRGTSGKTGEGIVIGLHRLASGRSDLDEQHVTWTLSLERGEEVLWRESYRSTNAGGSLNIPEGTPASQILSLAEQQLAEQMWKRATASLLEASPPAYVFAASAREGLGSSELSVSGGGLAGR